MSMTILFSNAGDQDCQTLKNLWKDVADVNVIELTRSNHVSKQTIRDAISAENDFLLLCGHGSPEGLLYPDFRDYAFDKDDIPLVHARQVFCLWCYASLFCKENDFRVLTSSMYISNSVEASFNGIPGIRQDYINDTNNHTFTEMNHYYHSQTPVKEWPSLLMSTLDCSNPIDSFNRQGMMYLGE